MSKARLEYLFNSYLHHNCSKEEEEELMALLTQPENDAVVQAFIDKVIETTESDMQMPDDVAAAILENILKKDKGAVVTIEKKRKVFPWLQVAAIFILFLAGTLFWVLNKKDAAKQVVKLAPKPVQIIPGGNHALLTMVDGRTIILDSMQSGTLQQGGAQVIKQDGLLIYKAPAATSATVKNIYNVLSTPKGGQYEVVLPDGSKVWLNAASSLHFPIAFTGNQREVELTGEAYFEVAKDRKKPFRVKVGSLSVNVLGTHFNINAYTDEDAIKTTLLEGKVKIIKGKASGLLKPGQQAVLNKKEDNINIAKANINEAVAWKNGLFQFEGADITTIMREISRWYDVEVMYAGKVPTRSFEGKISRSAQLSEVLQILELSNIKFTVEGRKIIVQ